MSGKFLKSIPSLSYLPLYENELLPEKKYDGRLFPEFPLYCEGMERPVFRGFIHLFGAMLLPLGLWHLWMEANHKPLGQAMAATFILCNLWCFGISSLFHIGRWSVSQEIFLQKLDHSAIAIYTAGVNMPVAFLLLPQPWGYLFAVISLGTCLWACWNILHLRPSVWRLVVVATSALPFFPLLATEMWRPEFVCVLINCLCQILGTAVFVYRVPNPWRGVFGYHEVFHSISFVGSVALYLMNWSVIRRTCDPFAADLDVYSIAWRFLFSTDGAGLLPDAASS